MDMGWRGSTSTAPSEVEAPSNGKQTSEEPLNLSASPSSTSEWDEDPDDEVSQLQHLRGLSKKVGPRMEKQCSETPLHPAPDLFLGAPGVGGGGVKK